MFHRIVYCMLLAIGLSLMGTSSACAEEYPYTAYVTADETEVRYGPSAQHYATQQLFAGEEVQVYRRDATGWLAVRPPEGSYSWIVPEAVEETNDEGIYRVILPV